MAAVGHLNHEAFVKMVEERMADLQPKSDFVRAKQIYTGGNFVENREIEQAHVLIGFPSVSYHSEQYYHASIMSTILGGSMSSRLFQEIREKRGLVYSVYSFSNAHLQSGLFGVYAGLNAEEIRQYIPVVSDELKKICQDKVSDKELNRVKVQLKASILMALESSSSTAEVIARQRLIHGRVIPTNEIVERIENVTKEDIRSIAQQIFTQKPTYTLLGNLKEYPSYDELQKYLHI